MAERSTTTTTNNNNNNKGQNFHGVGAEYYDRFKEWWSIARQSEEPPAPFDFLTNMGARPEIVQDFLGKVVEDACPSLGGSKYYKGPGFIDYMTSICSATSTEAGGKIMMYNSQSSLHEILKVALWGRQPTEQDLLSLAELAASDPRGNDFQWYEILRQCVNRNSSSRNFLQSLFQLKGHRKGHAVFDFSAATSYYGPEEVRRALDHDCVHGMRMALPNINSLKLNGKWFRNALVEFLAILLQSTTLEKLELIFPSSVEMDALDVNEVSLPPANPDLPVCGIKSLTIDTPLSRYRDLWREGHVVAMRFLSRIPYLEHLVLNLWSMTLATVVPTLLSALSNDDGASTLKNLTINIQEHRNKETLKDNVLDILDTIKGNSSLKVFKYKEDSLTPNFRHPDLLVYDNKCLELLQKHNTTLCIVSINAGGGDYRFFSEEAPVLARIQYLLNLNRNGRAKARDATTKLVHFVDLLKSTDPAPQVIAADYGLFYERPYEVDTMMKYMRMEGWTPERMQLHCLNINYGLLHERPDLWSISTAPRSCKRKRAQD